MTERVSHLIIGAGHNGLACAATLAKAGQQVLVLESAGGPGGMAAPRYLGEYRFPGLAHLANPVSARMCKELDLAEYGYQPGQAADTISLDADGRHLRIKADRLEGEGISVSDAERWPAFRTRYLEFCRAIRPLFENAPPRLKDMPWADRKALAKLTWRLRFGLGREEMYEFLRVAGMNMHDVLDEAFDDPRLQGVLAADAVLGSAMGPRTPGTVLTWLQRLRGELDGPLSVQTGQGGLVQALAGSAEAAGTELRYGQPVSRIVLDADRVTGVELMDGSYIEAERVISGIDPRRTFLDLVGAPSLDTGFATRVGQIRGSGVVGKLHLALSGLPAFRGLDEEGLAQRLLISPDARYVERAFNHSKYDEISDEPVFEITIPSLSDASMAPEGHHCMSVSVAYLPYLLEGGWEAAQEQVADRLVGQLETWAPGLGKLVVQRELLSPQAIETATGATRGHWHHGELSMHQSFMMRPTYGAAQYATPVEGLYLCGAGSHPGGGLHGLPGWLAARCVLEGAGQ